MPATVEILFNPHSGSYAPRRIAELRLAFERLGAKVIESATGTTAAVPSPGATHLCVAGGDGTVREIAQALLALGLSLPLGHFPCGTVNLLALEAALDCDPEAFASRLLAGAERPHYAVGIESAEGKSVFLTTASVGPEADAVAAVSPRLKRAIGRLAYLVQALRLLGSWRRATIDIELPGHRIRCEAFHVAKGRYFAGPWSVAPEAAGHRPEMTLVALTTARRVDLLRFWWAILRGRPVATLPGVITVACTEFEATAEQPMPVQLDGDVAATLPARFCLVTPPLMFA